MIGEAGLRLLSAGFILLLARHLGPAEFGRACVTQRRYTAGWLPNDLTVADGRVWRGRTKNDEGEVLNPGTALNTPEERDFLELCLCGWVEPRDRDRAVGK